MDENLIDFDALKAPISDQLPAGEDLRSDASPSSAYYSLKDVRNTARAAERLALVDNEPLLNFAHQWNDILEQVPQLLTTKTKDLEFAAWFIEALARNYGFAGLACGFDTASVLIDNFWQDLYPTPDEDGLETRIAPLIGLNGTEGEGTLLMPIASIPITEHYGEQPYALWEYEQALEIDRLDETRKKQRLEAGGIELKDVLEAVSASGAAFYRQLYSDIENCIQSYTTLVEAMDSACGYPLPTTHIARRLQACLDAVTYLAEDKLQEQSIDEPLATEEVAEPEGEGQAEVGIQLNSRQEAINNLKKIAVFFKKTEPHSPMAYGIEQVVRWSDMSLPDLLEELISDGDARKGYFRLVGIVPEDSQ